MECTPTTMGSYDRWNLYKIRTLSTSYFGSPTIGERKWSTVLNYTMPYQIEQYSPMYLKLGLARNTHERNQQSIRFPITRALPDTSHIICRLTIGEGPNNSLFVLMYIGLPDLLSGLVTCKVSR